jgi:hypothetical protein
MSNGGSTVVDHSTTDPEIKGSHPADGKNREEKYKLKKSFRELATSLI